MLRKVRVRVTYVIFHVALPHERRQQQEAAVPGRGALIGAGVSGAIVQREKGLRLIGGGEKNN